jgi:hypothetical protein
MKALYAAIICWSICLLILLYGCTTPMPEGEPVNPPIGYIIHCIENPNDPFCKEVE